MPFHVVPEKVDDAPAVMVPVNDATPAAVICTVVVSVVPCLFIIFKFPEESISSLEVSAAILPILKVLPILATSEELLIIVTPSGLILTKSVDDPTIKSKSVVLECRLVLYHWPPAKAYSIG